MWLVVHKSCKKYLEFSSYIEVSLLLNFVRKNVAAHEIRHVTLLLVIGNYRLFHLKGH